MTSDAMRDHENWIFFPWVHCTNCGKYFMDKDNRELSKEEVLAAKLRGLVPANWRCTGCLVENFGAGEHE